MFIQTTLLNKLKSFIKVTNMKKEIVITSEMVKTMKTYHSGKEMKEGDNAVLCVLIDTPKLEGKFIQLICIQPSEIDTKYKVVDNYKGEIEIVNEII